MSGQYGGAAFLLLFIVCLLAVGLPVLLAKAFFDWMDFLASNVLLPLGGLIVTIFAGYAWKRASEEARLTGGWNRVWMFLLRYVALILVLFVFLHTSGLIQFQIKKRELRILSALALALICCLRPFYLKEFQ
ncbi:hypothetical protein ACFQ3W_23475 [Paenibacillus puldeungensis]|uniref:Uncharacterized protein n=1 Tax=Paenibacillus puldeungensis TaxID=696536 RepID=A0ABW3S3S8_9BACL